MVQEIENILRKNEDAAIIAFGETHHGSHDHFFEKLGRSIKIFDGVFWEKPVSDQIHLDRYVTTGEFDERLRGFINNAKNEGKNIERTLATILNYGRIQKVKIVAIDSSKIQTEEYNKESSQGRYFHRGKSREEDMFNNILNIYRARQKWMLICGARHLSIGKHHRSGDDSLGTRLKNKFGDKFVRIALVDYSENPEYIDGFDYIIKT